MPTDLQSGASLSPGSLRPLYLSHPRKTDENNCFLDSHSGGEKSGCKDSAATQSNKYRIAIICVILLQKYDCSVR